MANGNNTFGDQGMGLIPATTRAVKKGAKALGSKYKSNILDPTLDMLWGPPAPKVVPATKAAVQQTDPEQSPSPWTPPGQTVSEEPTTANQYPYQKFPPARPSGVTYGRAPQAPPQFPFTNPAQGRMGGRANAALSRFMGGTNVGALGGASIQKALQDESVGQDMWQREHAADLNTRYLQQAGLLTQLSPQHRAMEMVKVLGPMAGMFPQTSEAYKYFLQQAGFPGGTTSQTQTGMGEQPQAGGATPTTHTGTPAQPEQGRGGTMAFLENMLPGASAALPWMIGGTNPWLMAGKLGASAILPYLTSKGIGAIDPLYGTTTGEHPIASGLGSAAGFLGARKFGPKAGSTATIEPTGGSTTAETAGPQPSAPPAGPVSMTSLPPLAEAAKDFPAPKVRLPQQQPSSGYTPSPGVPMGPSPQVSGSSAGGPIPTGFGYTDPAVQATPMPPMNPAFAEAGPMMAGAGAPIPTQQQPIPPVIPKFMGSVEDVPYTAPGMQSTYSPVGGRQPQVGVLSGYRPQGAAPGMQSSYYPESGPKVGVGSQGQPMQQPAMSEEQYLQYIAGLSHGVGTPTAGYDPRILGQIMQQYAPKYGAPAPGLRDPMRLLLEGRFSGPEP